MNSTRFKGKLILSGACEGVAIVSSQPINWLSSYSINLALSWKKGKISDRSHELLGQDLRDKILFVPCAVGSTTGGLLLLEAIKAKITPKAIVLKEADTLTVSGAILADIWVENLQLPPILECSEIFNEIKSGDRVKISKDEIEIIK